MFKPSVSILQTSTAQNPSKSCPKESEDPSTSQISPCDAESNIPVQDQNHKSTVPRYTPLFHYTNPTSRFVTFSDSPMMIMMPKMGVQLIHDLPLDEEREKESEKKVEEILRKSEGLDRNKMRDRIKKSIEIFRNEKTPKNEEEMTTFQDNTANGNVDIQNLSQNTPQKSYMDSIIEKGVDESLKKKKRRERKKRKIHKFLEDPTTSIFSWYYHGLQILTIIVSTISFVISSGPEFWEETPFSLQVIEFVVISIFTFDYLARLYTSSKKLKWSTQFSNVIDLLAILPFYIELSVFESSNIGGLAVLRATRLLRMFRIIKAGKYTKEVPVILETFRRSKRGFSLLLFGLSLLLVLFSSAIFYAEQTDSYFDSSQKKWFRSDGSVSPFQSILSSIWWCMVTVTTVGYGDMFPVTPAGKIVASLTFYCGILTLAFPMVIFSQNFQIAQTKRDRLAQTERREKDKIKKKHISAFKWKLHFSQSDDSDQERVYDELEEEETEEEETEEEEEEETGEREEENKKDIEDNRENQEDTHNEDRNESTFNEQQRIQNLEIETMRRIKLLSEQEIYSLVSKEMKDLNKEVFVYEELIEVISYRIKFMSELVIELQEREKLSSSSYSRNTSPRPPSSPPHPPSSPPHPPSSPIPTV